MIACHCNSVCDRTVLSAIASGATTIDALSDVCGAGARCGGCHDQLGTLVAAARAVDQAFGGSTAFGTSTALGSSTAFGELPDAGNSDLREAAFG